MLSGGLNVIIDGQWGSTGKGKLAGWVGKHHEGIKYACSSFGPNAGHTYVDDDGNNTVYKVMPMAGHTANVPALIMPDSVVSVDRLLHEMKEYSSRVFVHPNVAVLTEDDSKSARETGRHLAGTMQGTGHAISKKLLRIKGVKLAKDVLPAELVADTCEMVYDACKAGDSVVFEMSQGFDLSLNHGHAYPYVTSRDITVAACLNSAGIPPSMLGSVIGSLRTFPIRVGNIEGGWSGPCHEDQHEMSWPEVAEQAHGPSDLVELTTVTKRVRRVFTFSMLQVERFQKMCNPDYLFVNFIQYLDWKNEGVTRWEDLTDSARNFVNNLQAASPGVVALIGTGAKDGEMVVRI